MDMVKPLITEKYSEKRKKHNLMKTRRILKPKCKLSGGPIFTFSLPGRASRHSASPPVTPLVSRMHAKGRISPITAFLSTFRRSREISTGLISRRSSGGSWSDIDRPGRSGFLSLSKKNKRKELKAINKKPFYMTSASTTLSVRYKAYCAWS